MRTVVIPIETKVRELYGKLWLGLHLVKSDYEVVLGPSDEIKNTLHISKPDIYIAKDPGDNNVEFFRLLNDSGCRVCGLDPEGAVFSTLSNLARNKKHSLNSFDIYFAWGETQAELLRGYTDKPKNIIPTGNPRFDLLNEPIRSVYDQGASQLQNKYGKFILFNMNFSWANHFKPKQHIKQQERLFNQYDLNKYSYISELFHEFITAIHSLQPHKQDFNIVIRPHPSENQSTYKKHFRNYGNVFIESSGDVRHWIAASSAVIHNSCTTGIESAMMEQPALAYRPIQNENYDKELPNFVSEEIDDKKTLLERILYYKNSSGNYSMNENQRKELKRYFHNLDKLAAELISEKIDTLDPIRNKSYGLVRPKFWDLVKFRLKNPRVSGISTSAYDQVQRLRGNHQSKKQRKYANQKFPGLSRTEIEKCSRQLLQYIHLNQIKINKLKTTDNSFKLEKI